MKQIIKLLKLTLTEKRRLILSFISSLFVSFFTYVFVNLIQPIIDIMFLAKPTSSQGKGNLAEAFFNTVKVSRDDLMWMIPLLLVVVVFGKGLFTFLASYYMRTIGLKVVKGIRDDLFEKLTYQCGSAYLHLHEGLASGFDSLCGDSAGDVPSGDIQYASEKKGAAQPDAHGLYLQAAA
jgi:subfamily B ATP-binding cassette protein MsbA